MINDIYMKDDNNKYILIKLDITSAKELEEKFIVVTVGSNEDPATNEALEYVQRRFLDSKIVIDAMKHSQAASLLILPHTIKIDLISKKDLENKTICIKIKTTDEIANLPEIANQIKGQLRKDVIILPAPISVKEYSEIKDIVARLRTKKQRGGGGLGTKK